MKKKKGFTLIEIIVCIGLIAVVSVGSIIGIKLVDKKLVIDELDKISDKIEQAVEVYIETDDETYNQLYNEGNGAIIPLTTLYDEGLISLTGTSLTKENLEGQNVTVLLSNENENCENATEITPSWSGTHPIYICTTQTVDTSGLESEIENLKTAVSDLTTEINNIKNNSSGGNSGSNSGTGTGTSSRLYDKIINSAINASASDEANGIAVYRDNPTTTIGNATTTEAELIKTEDYIGTTSTGNSFYFRGNVKNNYINYSGKCWRIVRTLSDESVKIILEDNYSECDGNNYTGNWTISNSTWNEQWKQYNTYYSAISSSYVTSYKYTSDEIKYVTLKNSSSTFLKTLDHNDIYYRYSSILDRYTSLLFAFPITIKEIIYAGGSNDNSNSYYLINQYQKNNNIAFWTGDFVSGYGYYIHPTEKIYYADWNNSTLNIRPNIVLGKTVKVTGTGTKEAPYVVQK